jgi:GT2 family glycosyltransferase
VRIVENPSNRYIFGLNDGLVVARGRYVAFCNNDMTVEDDFLEALFACFDADDVFAACARIVQPDGRDQGSRTAGVWKHGLMFYEPLPHVDAVTSCFFAVGGQSLFRRDQLLALGSIDELLWPMYHEDIELSYRAWKAGLRILYAPGAVCHHLGSQTSARVFTSVELRSFVRQNELLTVWKNVDDPGMLLQHVAWVGPRLVLAGLRGDRGTLVGSWHALRRLPRALRARRGAQRSSRRSDRDVLSLIGPAAIEASARVAP